jgi:hypothetical protein
VFLLEKVRLGWYLKILQKSERIKRNQEDFINEIVKNLLLTGNKHISFIPDFERNYCNRLFTGEKEVPEEYKIALPLSDEEKQVKRLVKELKKLNKDDKHNFDFTSAVKQMKFVISRENRYVVAELGEQRFNKLDELNGEKYLSLLLIYVVNVVESNSPKMEIDKNGALLDEKIIYDNILRYIENELIIDFYSNGKQKSFEKLERNKALYFEIYTPKQLQKKDLSLINQENVVRLLCLGELSEMPIIQQAFVIKNNKVDMESLKFIEENFKEANGGFQLLAGYFDNLEDVKKMLDQYFNKAILKTGYVKVNSWIATIKTNKPATGASLKKSINLVSELSDILTEHFDQRNVKSKLCYKGDDSIMKSNHYYIFFISI